MSNFLLRHALLEGCRSLSTLQQQASSSLGMQLQYCMENNMLRPPKGQPSSPYIWKQMLHTCLRQGCTCIGMMPTDTNSPLAQDPPWTSHSSAMLRTKNTITRSLSHSCKHHSPSWSHVWVFKQGSQPHRASHQCYSTCCNHSASSQTILITSASRAPIIMQHHMKL